MPGTRCGATSSRERLSATELADLLIVFGAVNFDRMPSNTPAAETNDQSTVTLMAARYQNVSIEGRESELAPVVRRIDELAARGDVTHPARSDCREEDARS